MNGSDIHHVDKLPTSEIPNSSFLISNRTSVDVDGYPAGAALCHKPVVCGNRWPKRPSRIGTEKGNRCRAV